MSFDEANTVRDGLRDHLKQNGWIYVPAATLPRSDRDVLAEPYLKTALIRLNPEIARQPERADEVIYRLRTILLAVQGEGLVRANERFAEILCGGLSMPFGENYRHVPVKIIDFAHPASNHFVTTTEYSYTGAVTRRADNVLLVNGIPLVVGECKTPVRPAITWIDAAEQVHDDYETNIPALFVPGIFAFATEGKTFYYGAVRAPLDAWAPWKEDDDETISPIADVMNTAMDLLAPATVLDILKNYTLYATDTKNRKIKIVCRPMIVCYDRQSCVQYKEALDRLIPPEASEIVMTLSRSDPDEWKRRWDRSKEDEEKILDRYRDPLDPLQFVIVTAKLLTGFDAPILQTMYLDKLMKNHTLLQAICRTNRPYPGKSFGLIVDYIGVFDEVAKSLAFDEKRMKEIVTNIDSLKEQFPDMLDACLAHFRGIYRGVNGWEGLTAAQECIPTNEARDAFALDYVNLAKLWEAISPDPFLTAYKEDYRWLTQVYESVRPVNCAGRLLWKKLGAKTIEIIHENVHVSGTRDDFDEIVIDEDTVRDLLENRDEKKIKTLETRIIERLRKHANKPAFVRLGERLEQIKEQYERGFIDSLEFLKSLIQLARDVVKAEKEVETLDEQQRAKAALTELFEEARTDTTPVIIERIVSDIDAVVRAVRFDGWQAEQPGGAGREEGPPWGAQEVPAAE